MADELRVNGALHSWGSIVLKVGIERFTGFTEISYEDKLETAMGYGMGKAQAPRGQTRGKYTPGPVKLKGPKASMVALRNQLAALGDGRSFGQPTFGIVVQYIESNSPITDELKLCRYVGTTASSSEGPDQITEEVELTTRGIVWNGKTLYDQSGGQP